VSVIWVCVCGDGYSQVGGQSRLSENTLSPAVDVILALFEVRLSPAPVHTLIHTHTSTHSPEKLPDLSVSVKALIAVLTLCAGLRVYVCVLVCFCESVSHI